MSQRLTDSELLAFAGLARILFRLDGRFSEAEREVLVKVSADLLHEQDAMPGPYRAAPVAEPVSLEVTEDAIWRFIDRAAEAFPDEESVRRCALEVERPAARQAIFDALSEIAASDAISEGEWSMLEWLEVEWGCTNLARE